MESQPRLLHVRQRKRQVIIGEPETWINKATGEVLDVTPTTLVAGDTDFKKFWIANILAAVDAISNAKIRVLWYILGSIDPLTNSMVASFEEIARGSHTSFNTVSRTIKVLRTHKVVHRRGLVLQLNPNVMMSGSSSKRRAMLIRFEQLELPLQGSQEFLPPEQPRALRAV